jgi:hypothetical protein
MATATADHLGKVDLIFLTRSWAAAMHPEASPFARRDRSIFRAASIAKLARRHSRRV